MKKQAKILIMLIAVFTAVGMSLTASSSQGKRYMTLGVAFYNLENLFDTINNNGKYDKEFSPQGDRKWDSRKYWSKINNMAYAISQMATGTTPKGPAVIGVSEIENKSVLVDLVNADAIKDLNLQVIHHDSPDRRGVDVSLLYNPMFFKPINVTNHTLTIEGKPYFKTRDQMVVVGLLAGSRVGIIVNHWPSRLGGEEQSSYLREAAAALCRHISDSLLKVDPNMGIIIMGDLNDDPMNRSCAVTLDAKRKAKDVKKGGFFNPFWDKLENGIGSYIYRGKWDLFDQIIINYNLLHGVNGLKYREAIVINKDFLKQQDGQYKGYPLRTFSSGSWSNGYSDHFPTEIFLQKEMP